MASRFAGMKRVYRLNFRQAVPVAADAAMVRMHGRKFITNQVGRCVQPPTQEAFATQIKWTAFDRHTFAAGAHLNFLRQAGSSKVVGARDGLTTPAQGRSFAV